MIGAKLIEAAGNGISTVAVAEAIDFDGTNDYLSRASDLVGNTDSKTFTFSAWVWYDGTSLGEIFQTEAAGTKGLRVYMNGTQIVARIYNSAGTLLGQLTAGLVAEKTFCNILISCDTNATTWAIYVNDVLAQTGTPTNALIDFAGYTPEIAGPRTGYFDGRLSNVFLDYTYRDLSIEANRRLFVTADLKPAADQAALNPILYLPMNDPTAPGVNAGTGGDFTLTGTVARSGRGPNQYNAPYSALDGAADFLSRTTAPTGIADSKTFTAQFVFRSDNIATGNRDLIAFGQDAANPSFFVRLTSGAELDLQAYNAAGSVFALGAFTGSVFKTGRNYVLTISVDLSDTAKRHVYINGEAASVTWSTYLNLTIDFNIATTPKYNIAKGLGTVYYNGQLGAVWFNTSYIDLSVVDNLAKFVTGTGIDAKPVDLGANGELPTGTAPIIYLPMYGNNAGKNYGTGGDFTVNSGPYTGARGPNEFWGNLATFNGTNSYLSKSGAISGLSNSKTFSLSLFFNKTLGTTTDYLISWPTTGGNHTLFFNTATSMNQSWRNTLGNAALGGWTPTIPDATNVHLLICVDMDDVNKCKIYINGTVHAGTPGTFVTGTTLDFASINNPFIGVFDSASLSSVFNGKLSEFYFTNQYIDFTQEANRLKFRDAFGNPVDLTQQIEDAAIPNPAIYMRFPPTAFGTNYGTGGDFTVNGTITDGGQL